MLSTKPEKTLPHREPFLWVTRLIDRNEQGTSGCVELDIPESLDIFRGHFPGRPIFPGVLQVEAAAQASLWVHKGELPEGSKMPEVLFVAVDSFKFKRPVEPPAVLSIVVKQEKMRGPLHLWSGELKCGGQVVSVGSFWVRLA